MPQKTLYLTLQFPSVQADGGDGGGSLDGGVGGDPLAGVDKVRLTVTAKGQTGSGIINRKAGQNTMVIKVTFTSYPQGEQAVVKIEALRGDLMVYENPPAPIQLAAGCTAAEISIGIGGCSQGTAFCDGSTCHDLLTEAANCGTCGSQCPSGSICQSGRCSCPSGMSLCDINGMAKCVDLSSDKANCGSCGRLCSGATSSCCSGNCKNVISDPSNCGSCNNICQAGVSCNSGTCTPQCPAGQMLCQGTCVDINYDPLNCGACGHACTGSQSRCCEGMCTSLECQITKPIESSTSLP